MKTLAYVTEDLDAPFNLEEIELSEPGADEVLVEITSTGLCHTDVSARSGVIRIPLPGVLGHEGAGIVKKVGASVTEFEPGDRVAMSYGYCGKCKPCIKGKPYACEKMGLINFCGVAWDGNHKLFRKGKPISSFFSQSSFAHHSVLHKNSLVKVPEGFPLELAGPLGCGIQTGAGIVLNSLQPEIGDSIVVFGCGAVGMSAIMGAKLCGCLNIIAVGGNAAKLELAKELGATHTINRKEVEDIPGEVRKITGSGAEYAVDTTGVPQMIMTGLEALCYTGKIATAGPAQITLHTGANLGARSIVGVTEGNSNPKIFIPQLMEYYKQGRFPVDKITKYYTFDQINKAIKDSHDGVTIKAVLVRKEIG